MARQSVTTQQITRSGAATTYAAPNTDGDIIDTGQVALHVKNGGSAAITVTAVTPVTVDGLGVDDLVVSVPAGGERFIGPFPRGTFGQAPDATVGAGRVLVGYSAITSVTRAVLAL